MSSCSLSVCVQCSWRSPALGILVVGQSTCGEGEGKVGEDCPLCLEASLVMVIKARVSFPRSHEFDDERVR